MYYIKHWNFSFTYILKSDDEPRVSGSASSGILR